MTSIVCTFAGNGKTPEEAIRRAHDELTAREDLKAKRKVGISTAFLHTPDDGLWLYTFALTIVFEDV